MTKKPSDHEPELEVYDRPEMPWERESEISSGSSSMATAGLEFTAIVCLFFAAGWWLDQKLKSEPWLFIGLGMLGVVVGMWRLVVRANRANRSSGGSKK